MGGSEFFIVFNSYDSGLRITLATQSVTSVSVPWRRANTPEPLPLNYAGAAPILVRLSAPFLWRPQWNNIVALPFCRYAARAKW
jgi:hypothetical protein